MGFYAHIQAPIGTIFCVFWHQELTTQTLVTDCHQRYKMSCISDLTPSTLLGCAGFIEEILSLKTSGNAVRVTDYTVEYDLKHAAASWEFKFGISG